MLEGCSEACPTHVALWAAGIHRNNGTIGIISPHYTTFFSHLKTSLFLSQCLCKSRKENSDITRATSHDKPIQRASQRSHGRRNLMKSWIIIQSQFQSASYPPEMDWTRCALDFKWIYMNATNWIGCAFDAHRDVHVKGPKVVRTWLMLQHY